MHDDLPEESPTNTLHVRFYMRPVVDTEATAAAGRTVHKQGPYVEISTPGDKTSIVDKAVREEEKRRFPRQWAAFQADVSQEDASGTLLSVWGVLNAAQVEDYRYFKVLTVEQLAGMSDALIARMGPGALVQRQHALDFLEASKSKAPLLRLQTELDEVRAQNAALVAALKQQGDRVDALAAGKDLPAAVHQLAPVAPPPAAAPKAKRGRPAKSAQA